MSECPVNNEQLSNSDPRQLAGTSPILKPSTTGITFNSVFDVNKMIATAQNYVAINATVNQMFGYNVKWFRAIPQQRSKDVIFQEYTLSNVAECPLDVKVIIPDGTMPDSKYNFDLMGLEYEIPVEIQIDKKYWESIAGFGTAPQKKDIVYFPLSNKLYQVESSYLLRGFMEQETTWKLNLRKYMPEASRKEGAALQETIDMYTVSTEEIFGPLIDNDVKKLVNDPEFNQLNSTMKDKFKSIDASLKTIALPIDIYGTLAAQSFYDLQASSSRDAIIYNGQDRITETSDRCLVAWIMPRTISEVNKEYDVLSITSASFDEIFPQTNPDFFLSYDASLLSRINYTIALGTPAKATSVNLGDYVTIQRPGALNFYAKVAGISINPLRIHCLISPFVIQDLNEIKSDWNSQRGYKLMAKEPISIIDGIDTFGDHVLSANIYANQYIAINYGTQYPNDDAYVVRMDDKLLDNQWYGVVVNIGNSWNQYNVYVWTKHETDKVSKMRNVFYETLQLTPQAFTIQQYSVNKSPAYLTNLRLYTATIEEEHQANELMAYFSKDADQLILADLAEPIVKMPYITKQR
jgi:hypothetical protein